MEKKYYILSVKHSTRDNGGFLVWWCPNRRGYAHRIDEAGLYDYKEAVAIINDGLVPRGELLARSSWMVVEDHEALFLEGDIPCSALEDSTHNLEALGAMEIWKAYHGE